MLCTLWEFELCELRINSKNEKKMNCFRRFFSAALSMHPHVHYTCLKLCCACVFLPLLLLYNFECKNWQKHFISVDRKR